MYIKDRGVLSLFGSTSGSNMEGHDYKLGLAMWSYITHGAQGVRVLGDVRIVVSRRIGLGHGSEWAGSCD